MSYVITVTIDGLSDSECEMATDDVREMFDPPYFLSERAESITVSGGDGGLADRVRALADELRDGPGDELAETLDAMLRGEDG